ncbi:SH3 domain-containing protein [Xylariales sp. AK1849]|nr:SH3 domain-containing protein [Xylariales sp. AK1849]
MATAPFKVRALYEYTSNHEDDLPFEPGQVLTVTDTEDPDWYGGEYVHTTGEKREGIFPRNFVEKYEPTAPPRPTRTRKKENEPVAAPPPPPPAAEPESEPEPVQEAEEAEEDEPIASPPPPIAEPRSPKAPTAPVPKPVAPAPVASPASVPTRAEPAAQLPAKAPAPARGGPPPVSEKPSSFKDRIAAFNKPAAPPVAPFKPGSLSSGGGTGFIKKPFVAPPPSRNAYVPPPREAPTAKVYRRDEDPEIKEREAENVDNAAKAGLAPAGSQESQGEDQPKPTSLKERIALLQKQQAEAANRHADAAAKKEKPKRPPPKKRTDSEGLQESTAAEVLETPSPLERRDTESMDESYPQPPPRQSLPTRRKSSKGPPEDGNEADMSGAGETTEGPEDLTEREDSDVQPKPVSRAPTGASAKHGTLGSADEDEDLEPAEEEEEEDDDDEDDPEVRRKEELRARMAKMSAGMGGMGGMMNPFAAPVAPGGAKKKKPPPMERRGSEQPEEEVASPRMAAPPIPTMMALPGMPGMGQKKPKQEDTIQSGDEESLAEEQITPVSTMSPRGPVPELPGRAPGGPPPVPGGRPAPPPVPAESRPAPPPHPPAAVSSPGVGSESDDEMSGSAMQSPLETPRGEAPPAGRAPPPIPLASPIMPTSPRPAGKRTSYIGAETSPTSPAQHSKRNSRPPPIPGAAPPTPTQNRPPPPPPPGVAPSRTSTSDDRDRIVSPMRPGHLDNGEEGESTEYEGDYDTDIGSSVPHKDALKSHARDSSLDDIPGAAAPRAVPPPVPIQPPPPPSRHSVDMPRGAPPPRPSADMPRAPPRPPPPSKTESYFNDEDEYDPYNYSAPPRPGASTGLSYTVSRHDEDAASPESTPSYQSPPPPTSRAPPPAPPTNRAPPRQSLEVQRPAGSRRSMDVTRPSMESGFVANDVDLAQHTSWWLQPNGLPPVFQGRRDIFFESEESTASAPGGRTVVTKEVYFLFQDYSQTIITAQFDPQNPSDTKLDQRHEPPPRSLRQDQLEQAYERYGLQIANTMSSKKDSVVGDGTPQGLIYELLRPFKDVLLPVGTRAYGALVYGNMANASTQVNDHIRPGDILSIRNAKFQGKHGPMHAKYSMEVGKPDHVAIVAEWDGTKKKVRAWEQGREGKKVKQESFKLDDLRSGEVKIWRIMPRSWVGWDSQN